MIWPHEIAMRQTPGAAWRPSNMTEAELFHAGSCAHCDRHEPEAFGCAILEMAAILEMGDAGYPPELRISAGGQPVCTAFRLDDVFDSPRCDRTPDPIGAA